MPDWSRLVGHLDENSKGQDIVPTAFDTVAELVGPLPQGAYAPPNRGVGYWRTKHIQLGPRWVVETVDWIQQKAYFRRRQASPEAENTSSVSRASVGRTIQDMLEGLRDVGRVTSVVVTRQIADGTELRLTVEPHANAQDRRIEDPQQLRPSLAPDSREDASPLVPSGRTIRDIPSELARAMDSIHGNDSQALRWPVDREWVRLDKAESYRLFKEKIRGHVKGVEDHPWLGGHGILATMSRKKSEQTGEVAAYSPAALGLRRTVGDTDLYNLVAQGKLRIGSIKGEGHDRADAIRIEVTNHTERRISLRIAVGTVFEQKDAPDVQDLVVRQPLEEVVEAGKRQLIKAYGLCMDQGGVSPSGEALLLTPWLLAVEPRMMADEVNSQRQVWDVTEGRVGQDAEAPPTRRAASGRKRRVQMTAKLAKQILKMRQDGQKAPDIAAEVGVSTGTVYRVLNGRHRICAEL